MFHSAYLGGKDKRMTEKKALKMALTDRLDWNRLLWGYGDF